MTAKCLFTGVELGLDTKIEHTIPESVGGRITSRTVCSSEFNNLCGAFCDDSLREAYGFLLARLGPLLPSRSQPAAIRAISSGSPDGLVIEPGAILSRRGSVVLERDPRSGRPTSILAPNEAEARKFAKQAGIADTSRISHVPLIDDGVVTVPMRAISSELELVALKSTLLSFDHLMSQCPSRFTRSRHLDRVRAAVRTSVGAKLVDSDLLSRCSLGIQLEKLKLYSALRAKMPVEETPFEHFMLVAGNRPQRCIDAVWMVFGFEPFGFRLCDSFDESDFCFGLINPVMKGTAASNVFELSPPDELLCRHTTRRSWQHEQHGVNLLATLAEVFEDVMARRVAACDRAVFEVHMRPESEQWLIARLRASRTDNGYCSIFDLLEARLCSLYPKLVASVDFKEYLASELARQMRATDMDSRPLASVEESNLWPQLLAILRSSLNALVSVFGMPGGGFFCDLEITNDEETWRRLGVKDG